VRRGRSGLDGELFATSSRVEGSAVIVEGFYFYVLDVFDLRRALFWSLLVNATSAGLGLPSRWAFGWP
jgi:hypothetical protein